MASISHRLHSYGAHATRHQQDPNRDRTSNSAKNFNLPPISELINGLSNSHGVVSSQSTANYPAQLYIAHENTNQSQSPRLSAGQYEGSESSRRSSVVSKNGYASSNESYDASATPDSSVMGHSEPASPIQTSLPESKTTDPAQSRMHARQVWATQPDPAMQPELAARCVAARQLDVYDDPMDLDEMPAVKSEIVTGRTPTSSSKEQKKDTHKKHEQDRRDLHSAYLKLFAMNIPEFIQAITQWRESQTNDRVSEAKCIIFEKIELQRRTHDVVFRRLLADGRMAEAELDDMMQDAYIEIREGLQDELFKQMDEAKLQRKKKEKTVHEQRADQSRKESVSAAAPARKCRTTKSSRSKKEGHSRL